MLIVTTTIDEYDNPHTATHTDAAQWLCDITSRGNPTRGVLLSGNAADYLMQAYNRPGCTQSHLGTDGVTKVILLVTRS